MYNVHRLFGGKVNAKADYSLVPTVVFSHPVIGTIGLTEKEAREKHGDANIKIYNSTFVNLFYGTFFGGEAGDKPLTKYKLVCLGEEERVIGLHCIGMASDEVIQGFGVAMKMGATKADFDSCIAIHPTAAEELVTMAPWGMSPSPTGRPTI
jgi:glutathione reductase (NADPH)